MTHIQSLSPKSRREGAREAEPSLGWAEWGSLGNGRILPFTRASVRDAAPVCVRALLVAFALVCIIAMVR
ncbi:MAG: hypothetical protein B7X99_14695 [Rhizobiales bacterium 17-65-6]|jgi:hypothetical protein|uniref:hypothetical protein n=1 Tax=Roseixanthobacter finlandensis TaxID=3119922 RepID=UPI000BD57A2D|nr:MAG: hypothetical protein B7Z41_06205 [Rhizobiales bacterium 12-66-7]OYZ96584.1 MAG: hypothetical protein B7X99_14695 [Rhizobiales bacterium 17-65-6]OZA98035.1 MAG: hypothetical protein B7X67_22385 [Rhizobiales bacterium 39-66-18]HQS10338.1 hypothetical protein [Xanthobacteraceae bacterium]HQS48136.1 hypothetical protein [Xanthobacteraceae bacterium]